MNGQLTMLSEVIRGAAAYMGVPWSSQDGVDVETFRILTPLLSARIQDAWMRHPWPEVTITTRRYQQPTLAEWVRPTSGSAYPTASYVFHRGANAYFYAVEAAGADEVPGESLAWVELTPRDPSAMDVFDTAESYSRGDLVYWPSDASVRYCLADTGPLPTPQTPYWTTVPEWTGQYDYYPVPNTDIRILQPAFTRLCGIQAAWDKDPLDLGSTELEVEFQPLAFRVEGHPGSCWVRGWLWCPDITGGIWDPATEYAAGDQVYYQDPTTGSGTWYDIHATLAAGTTPDTNALLYAALKVPKRLVPHLQAALAADWLRLDGQVDKARERDNAAAAALNSAIMDLLKRQRQSRAMPVQSR